MMTEPFAPTSEQLELAHQLKERMEQATHTLDEQLRVAEMLFTDLGLGVHACVQLNQPSRKHSIHQMLWFGKLRGTWRLWVSPIDPQPQPPQPQAAENDDLLSKVSRATRLKALEALPKLLRELLYQAEKETRKIEDAVRTAEAFISSLEASVRRVVDNECTHCHGSGHYRDDLSGGESYCPCPAGEQLKQAESSV